MQFSKSLDKIINPYTALSELSKLDKTYTFLFTACRIQRYEIAIVPVRTKMQLTLNPETVLF